MFAVIGVSAEWVDAGFTTLRVTVPEGVVYRLSYWAVNKSTGPELKVATTSSSSQVISDFSPDYIYTIVVEDWTGRAERGKQFPVLIVLLFSEDLTFYLRNVLAIHDCVSCPAT